MRHAHIFQYLFIIFNHFATLYNLKINFLLHFYILSFSFTYAS